MTVMGSGTLISLEDYLRTSFHPDCDFINGKVAERSAGQRRHGYAQARIAAWFIHRRESLLPEALTELRIRVAPPRIRVPDIVVAELPIPDEEVFTSPPYVCIEIMSPDDTMVALQDRIDDYLRFGLPNVWVIDPWKHRGWVVTPRGWAAAEGAVLRTADGRVAMPLADVLLP